MPNRLVVVFLPINTSRNPNPQPITLARGNFKNFAALKESCAGRMPEELTQPESSGHVFVGREYDSWMKNLVRFGAHADHWQGTKKSGSFEDFLKPHLESFLSTNIKTEEVMLT